MATNHHRPESSNSLDPGTLEPWGPVRGESGVLGGASGSILSPTSSTMQTKELLRFVVNIWKPLYTLSIVLGARKEWMCKAGQVLTSQSL